MELKWFIGKAAESEKILLVNDVNNILLQENSLKSS